MDFDARTLRPVADAAGVPVSVVVDVVAAALKDAYDASPNAQKGVSVRVDLDSGRLALHDEEGNVLQTPGFGARATTAARQAVVSWMRDRDRLRKVGRWGTLEGTPITVTVKGFGRAGETRLDAQGTAAVMPAGEAIAGEALRVGQEIIVLLLAANVTDRDTVRLTVSRRQPALVSQLFVQHLERTNLEVAIVSVAREPGARSKVACAGPGDPRAALVGPGGVVARSVAHALGGERVDLVRFNTDLGEYVASALTPARVSRVEVTDASRREVRVTVTSDQLALAQGTDGLNLRLATRLTGARISLHAEG